MNIKGTGLKVPKKQLINRDFSYSRYFGSPEVAPNIDFVIAEPLEVKDQQNTDMCAAFSLSSVSEDQEGILLEPAYTFAKIKQVMGDWKEYGGDPDSACKAAIKFGFLKKQDSPYSLDSKDRNFLANYENWSGACDELAYEHRKKAYFKADGQADLFDSIRAVLWQNRLEKRSIFAGIYWQPLWTYVVGGIIPKDSYKKVNPHAIKIYGQKIINGEPYLIVLNSWGSDVGDKGRFYLPREIANKLLFARTFKDVDPEDVKKETWTFLQKLKDLLVTLLKRS